MSAAAGYSAAGSPAVAAVGSGALGFGARLGAAIDRFGRLCVGIDPHPFLLDQWGLTDDAAGLRDFGLRVVAAAEGRVGIVKPQIAFFERHGSAGYAALEDVLAAARAAGLLVIADVKRGDVGTSVEAYGQAWLTPGSPLEADAMTVSAFQGLGSLDAPLALAARHGKGVFVLAATSNPEAAAIQTAVLSTGPNSGVPVAGGIVADVIEWNARAVASAPSLSDERSGERSAGRSPIADIGVVIGATVRMPHFGIDPAALAGPPATPVLAPGFGHQGAAIADLAAIYGPAAPATIVTASRSILSAGPGGIVAAITEQAHEVSA